MNFILTAHARKRIMERSIPENLIAEALIRPTQQNQQRLLLIAGVKQRNLFRVITVIDTSKVRKYL